jgi:hypothetical protein
MTLNTLRKLATVLRWLAIIALAIMAVWQALVYFNVLALGDCLAQPRWLGVPCARAWYMAKADDLSAHAMGLGLLLLAIVACLIIRDASSLKLFRRHARPTTAPRLLAFDHADETGNVRHVAAVITPRKGKARKPAGNGTGKRHSYRDPRTNKFVSAAAYAELVRDGIAQPLATV